MFLFGLGLIMLGFGEDKGRYKFHSLGKLCVLEIESVNNKKKCFVCGLGLFVAGFGEGQGPLQVPLLPENLCRKIYRNVTILVCIIICLHSLIKIFKENMFKNIVFFMVFQK